MSDTEPIIARKPPSAPSKMGAAGRKLWRAMTGAYDFEGWELAVLEAACRQRDDVALLEEHLREVGLTVEGSKGQERLNPALAEVRLARANVARLLAQLKLPDVDDPATGQPAKPLSGRGRQAQAAANRRWSNHRRRRDGAMGLVPHAAINSQEP